MKQVLASEASWILTGVLVLSLFSGYQAVPVPGDIVWAFSPLGWLESGWQGMWARWGGLRSAHLFRGELGWTVDYFGVFLKTCALEAPFYWLLLRKEPKDRALRVLVTANAVTHPAVFFLIPVLFSSYLASALVSELFAPIAEIAVVLGFLGAGGRGTVIAAVAAIVAANLFSWQVGGFL